jgi:hypothetical protein
VNVRGVLVVAVAALALAGCAKKRATDQVPDEALDAIAAAASAQLNAPVTSIYRLLHQANLDHRVNWPDLTIGFDNRAWPVSWWLYRHGYVELSGLAPTAGAPFILAKKAADYDAAGDLPWFSIEAGAPVRVDCTSPTLPAGACDVEVPLTPKLTSEGEAAGAATPAAFTVDATVTLAEDGWVVGGLTPVGTVAPHNLALVALLGPEGARAAALAQVNGEIAVKTGADSGAPQPASLAAIVQDRLRNGVAAPPPPDDTPPPPPEPVAPERDRQGRLRLQGSSKESG